VAVGITVGSTRFEIGAPDFLYAFFSTISVHGEPGGWGSRFPNLIHKLCSGSIGPSDAAQALLELQQARAILSKLPPSEVVWDFDKRSASPPWGSSISPQITNLGNYFVSSTGRDVFELIDAALQAAVSGNRPARIE